MPDAPARPAAFDGDWAELVPAAIARREPLLMPLRAHLDDRGWSLMNLLAGALDARGQVNFSLQFPGAVKAWHRHRRQTDVWICLHGELKAGVVRADDDARWLACLGEHAPAALAIPPGLWHGATALGAAPAGLLYYVTERYDPAAPDEERCAWDAFAGFPWGIRHG